MTRTLRAHQRTSWTVVYRFLALLLAVGLLSMAGCASGSASPGTASPTLARTAAETAPSPDPRIGLGAGLFDAEEAIWNLRLLSATPPRQEFVGITNSDLAFRGVYAIQGNYNGIQVWNIEDPRQPLLVTGYVCPASQSDVSVYGDLLFVSGEGLGRPARLWHGWGPGVCERGAPSWYPDLRYQRHPEPSVHRQCADLPRVAHAHFAEGPERRRERVHLRFWLLAGASC